MSENLRIKPIEKSTNKTWEEWVTFMDRIDGKHLDHRAIAQKVYEELDGKIESAGWWSQSVTVAYEQYIGRRIPGQRQDGTFEANVSKSTNLSMNTLMEKWIAFAAREKEVRALIEGDSRVSGTEKRLTWRAKGKNGSSILVTSEPKKDGAAAIIVTHQGLLTNELKDEMKTIWTAILKQFLGKI